MRKSTVYLMTLACLFALAVAAGVHAFVAQKSARARVDRGNEVVRRFQLTDLNLFNEARYTRHLSQADLHAPFQDHPLSLEHFPPGSLARPPSAWPSPSRESVRE